MMAQEYYASAGFDNHYRSQERAAYYAPQYDRGSPYGYTHYPHRPELRHDISDSNGRAAVHEPQEPNDLGQTQQPGRKRIAVACSRCRRRKIKCSGDPGDGMGCSACRGSGETGNCTFMRVQARDVDELEVRQTVFRRTNNNDTVGAQSSAPNHHSDNYGVNTYYTPSRRSQPRPSLSIPSTRGAIPLDYDQSYENSPAEGYEHPPSTQARHDSLVDQGQRFRSWSSNPQVSTPVTTSYHYNQQYPMSTFGNMQSFSSYPPLPTSRQQSISDWGGMSMNTLSSTFPSQTTHDQTRQLPIPQSKPPTPSYFGQRAEPPVPHFKPFDPFPDSRSYMYGYHNNRNLSTFSFDSGSSSSRNHSLVSIVPATSMAFSSAHNVPTLPISGMHADYEIGQPCGTAPRPPSANPATAGSSPSVSPTSGRNPADRLPDVAVSSPYTATLLPPMSTTPLYFPRSTSIAQSVVAVADDDDEEMNTPSSNATRPNIFTFSSDNKGQASGNDSSRSDHIAALRETVHQDHYTSIRQPSQHSITSHERRRRTPPYEQRRRSSSKRPRRYSQTPSSSTAP